jgi:glycosyltransferase involved in cell wall biosynthesis
MTARRLYYLDDIPTPYRVGVQRRVAAEWGGPMRIAYCAASEPGRTWNLDLSDLDIEVLRGKQWRPARQVNPMSLKWNVGIWSSLAAFKPDVVVLSGYVHPTIYMAAYWCQKHGVPYAIASETTVRSTHLTGPRWYLKKIVAGWLVKRMAFGLPTGREAAEYFHTLGATDKPMYFFPNTPDTTLIVNEAESIKCRDGGNALRASIGIPVNVPIILFVGRMIEAKRPLDLVHAFRKLRPEAGGVVLVMVGDGELLPAVKAAAAGLPVIFTGWLKDTVITTGLMAISRVLVLPSQHETWGAVVNESMAAGTPVVASNRVGAAIEMIESGVTGFVYPVGDVDALAEALIQLISAEELCAKMGREARQVAISKNHVFAASNLISGARKAIVDEAIRAAPR